MSVYYSDEYLSNHDYLQHYGKKGMKWGVVNEVDTPVTDRFKTGVGKAKERAKEDAKILSRARTEANEKYNRAMKIMDAINNHPYLDSDDIYGCIDEMNYYVDSLAQLGGEVRKNASSPLARRFSQTIYDKQYELQKNIKKAEQKAKKLKEKEQSAQRRAETVNNVKNEVKNTVKKAGKTVKSTAKKTVKKAKANINKGVNDIKNEVSNKKKKVESFIGSILD